MRVENPRLLFLSTGYIRNPGLSGVAINSAHSHLLSHNKRETPIHIPCLIYSLSRTKVLLALVKGNVGGYILTL